MKRWLIGVVTVLMTASLTVCTPTTEKQRKETAAAAAAKPQEDMAPPSTDGAGDKVPDPNVIPVAVISTYHEGGRNLVRNMDSLDMEGLDTQLLVDELIEYGTLTDNAEILSFDIERRDENTVGALDLSQAGSVEDYSDKMFLTEIGNTFTENFELSRLKLKVNGGNYEGDDTKQGDNDYLTYDADYESVG